MERPRELLSLNLERALRWAANCHHGQFRKGCDAPYIEHLVGVAMILDRLGFAEEVIIAGLLHDVVEDTATTLEQIEARFGPAVAATVEHCSEIKLDGEGRKRPWIDRKRDHLDALERAPVEARAVVLADKLHNLLSIELDLSEGRPVWPAFHAKRDQVLWYYRTAITRFGSGDPRLDLLAARSLKVLAAIETMESAPTSSAIETGPEAGPTQRRGNTHGQG